MVLGQDGQVVDVASHLIAQHEMTSSLFVDSFTKVLFYATDPVENGLDGDKMRLAVETGIGELTAKFQNPAFLLQHLGIPIPIKTEGQ
jgi:hypothetical protein